MAAHKPGELSRDGHAMTMATAHTQRRIARGRRSSDPTDYRNYSSEEDREARKVRSKIEDMNLLRELGLDPRSSPF